jgi:hypothetical protein
MSRMSERALTTGGAIVALLTLAAALTATQPGSHASAAAIAGMIVVTVEGSVARPAAAPARDGAMSKRPHAVTVALRSASRPAPLHRQWWRLDLPPPAA